MREAVKAALRLAVKAQLRNIPARELRIFEEGYSIGFKDSNIPDYPFIAIPLPVIDTDNESEIEKAIAWLTEQIDKLN
jgi:hypothetical protein